MEHERCEKGITARALRWAVRDELQRSRTLVVEVARISGLAAIKEVGAVQLRNRHGLTVSLLDHEDTAIDIRVNVHIDDHRGMPIFVSPGAANPIRRITAGPSRVVTLAPLDWFRIKSNAALAVNKLPLEFFRDCGSRHFREAVGLALDRAAVSFNEMRKPKQPSKVWMTSRGWRPRPLATPR